MLTYPEISPIAIELGPLAVRWYGLMYVIGILGGWWLGRIQARRPWSPVTVEQVDDLVTWIALGVILGGRVGWTLFYNFGEFISNPLTILQIWQGGMSFHGGLIGVTLGLWIYCRKYQIAFFAMTDFVSPLIPIGLGAGRIGNFINGELWGKTTDVPWAFIVNGVPRHASQLYEAFFEGLCLLLVLVIYPARERPRMAVTGVYLTGYGIARFGVEFVRLPDANIGYMAWGWLTRGQLLSAPMIILGILLIILAYRRDTRAGT